MRWSAAAALVMVVAIVMIGPRGDLTAALGQPAFLGSLVALLLTLASGAAAAFVLSVPGAERSPAPRVLPVLTAAAWAAIWLVVWSTAGEPAGPRTAACHRACAIQLVVCALATGWLLLAMIARAAPLRPVWTAVVAGLASMAAGAMVAQVFCPIDDPRHQLAGHVLVALVVASVGVLVGRAALRASSR